jgi:multiple sugar transport system substrate-binding protein
MAYLAFMYGADRFNAWLTGASAYCCQPLRAFASNPVWTSDPIHAPYAKASESLRPNGYAGPLGAASAGVMAEYVVVDMFAEAVTGAREPEDAIKNAVRRANRYYKI